MSLQIITGHSLERARMRERAAQKFAHNRAQVNEKRHESTKRESRHIAEESRAILEKKGFFKRD